MNISEASDAKLLPEFKRQFVEVDGNKILALVDGSGPGLLMLHGDPQTHLCWRNSHRA
ncbi:Fluoroacetate dehalogenase [compost metagenome]